MEWDVPTVSLEEILETLNDQEIIVKAEFKPDKAKYGTITRYLLGKHSSYELALSLQRNTFLSHGTALAIHKAAASENTIYVNREQSPKDRATKIRQAGIRLAFRNKQRQSKYVFGHSGINYILLNGKYTGHAGVKRIKTISGETLHVTDIERTLIDAVVRPSYAGGIENVAEAYLKEGRGN